MLAGKRCLLPSFLLVVAAVLPVAAHAEHRTSAIHVSYADLNLATANGVTTLYERIHHAAAGYCEPARELVGTRVAPEFSRCVRDAVASTVRQIGHPGLSALHAARGGARADLQPDDATGSSRTLAFG
jgi:UrcA family protein